MKTDRNLNALWLRCILDEVLKCGVQDAVLCPGGRSIALCLAIRHHPLFDRAIPYTDERSASFLAMGLARSSDRPVVIVTTSGSAVANLVPALTEAQALQVPLILLTCDRPRHLRNAGYGQMTDHIGATRAFVCASLDLPDPIADNDVLITLRAQISTVISNVANPEVKGIVHINIPMEGEHDSTEIRADWRVPAMSSLALDGRKDCNGVSIPMTPFSRRPTMRTGVEALIDRLRLRPGLRGLIVAGPECPISNSEVDALSTAVGYPVLADAASGLRRPEVSNLVMPLDALSASPGIRTQLPQLVIRLGLEPTLVSVHQYLLQHPCPAIKITTRAVERDYLHPGCENLVCPDESDLAALRSVLAPGNATWLARWKEVSDITAGCRKHAIQDMQWGEFKAAHIICNAEHFGFLHYANSMSIRNGDICTEPTSWSQKAFSNRGVNGIDGTIGTFIGEMIGTRETGLLLLGDLAFVHDLSALAYPEARNLNGCICVMNNGGGAIFDLLPASQLPEYEKTIRNTARIDIGAAAACFGLPHHLAQTEIELKKALLQSAAMGGLHVIEIRVPAHSLRMDHTAMGIAISNLAEL